MSEQEKTNRFTVIGNSTHISVIDIPLEKFNKLPSETRLNHRLLQIRHGGMVSESLALSWANKFAELLNQADTSIYGLSKIHGPRA